jgi:glutamate synthase (ferredoxin)
MLTMAQSGTPSVQGLYNASYEHDSCGVGFIAHVKGQRSHQLVRDGITALEHLAHRGATGSEANTGDGAGILIQVPHEFFMHRCATLGVRLPEPGRYGVGLFFSSRSERARDQAMSLFTGIVQEEGQHLLGWREVPTNNASLGEMTKAGEPVMYHVFVGCGEGVTNEDAFERKLYVIRRQFEKAVQRSGVPDAESFYIASLSCRTLVYKGMLMATQLAEYFPDLSDRRLISALIMFHSRFSTNTFPSWRLAHPYRMISHNGEINTLRGNVNWMRARESLLESRLFDEVQRVPPIIDEGGSDTACFDNALELLVMAGRSLPHAMMMLIPEAWDGHESMSAEKKAFYEYHSCLMEPWDGPASIVFTDGRTIGATLDRNGLRPSRYYVTKDDLQPGRRAHR